MKDLLQSYENKNQLIDLHDIILLFLIIQQHFQVKFHLKLQFHN